jgi:glycosyltransferase involved in cell wall biosynthesis
MNVARTEERIQYAFLLASMGIAYLLVALLCVVARGRRRRPDKDLVIYVHGPADSVGYLRRFEFLRPFLDADGVRYDIKTHFDDKLVNAAFSAGRKAQYKLYSRILWRRVGQVWQGRRYKAAFVQRSLFALYPDARTPYLERLLRRLCDNITLDFWDPVHLWQPELTFSSFQYADKIAVVNEGLFAEYSPRHPNVRILPIAIDLGGYVEKVDYALHRPVRLFYTGSAYNVTGHLVPLLPVLEDLAREYDLELTVVGPQAPPSHALRIRHLRWDAGTYYQLLADSDLALFPFFGPPEQNRQRVASKTLDYLAAGVPFVGVVDGLAAGVEPDRHFMAVRDPSQWPSRLREALQDRDRRESVGRAARRLVETSFSLRKSYDDFKRIAFEQVIPR